MPKQQSSRWYQIDRFIPWLILFILASQTYAKFFLAPYAGFQFSADKVGDIFVQSPEGDSLEIGDRIIRIGPVVWQQYLVDLRQTVFDEVIPGQIVLVVVDRNGQIKNIDWTFPGPTQVEVFERLNGLWWMAYVFWFAGTATLLFIRPKETSQRMMAAFFYLTAIWLAAGSGPSAWHIGYSALILTSTIWLCIPIYLQFHWLFPKPLGRLPTDVWIILHLAGSILAVLQWFRILPARAYLTGFFLALAGSVILLAVHFIRQPEQRHDIRLLTVAVGTHINPFHWIRFAFCDRNSYPPLSQRRRLPVTSGFTWRLFLDRLPATISRVETAHRPVNQTISSVGWTWHPQRDPVGGG